FKGRFKDNHPCPSIREEFTQARTLMPPVAIDIEFCNRGLGALCDIRQRHVQYVFASDSASRLYIIANINSPILKGSEFFF
ncbi:MAG TPA: hypothetical protein PLC04_08720, partial [Candidatus Kapabacteria bacterium]|nr:hypothetical protein [Candidatus Kapabacteria bacterium]